MKTRNTKWAAAAAVIVVIIAAIVVLDKSAPAAFGLQRVLAAYNNVRSLHVKIYAGQQQEPNEFWIVSDEHGQVAKARYYLPVTEDGIKLITWTPERSEIWFKSKRGFATFQTKRIAPWMQSLLDQSQPELAIKKLLDAQNAGKVEIQTRETGGQQPVVVLVATYKTEPRREIYTFDPKTDLVTRIDSYRLEGGVEVLRARTEFCDYNTPLDEKMFSLRGELPRDVRISDRLNQVCGVAQGTMTDEEAAAETVRQFFQALIDKDYKKAGLIMCGELEEYARAEYGKLNVTSIVSIGPAVAQTNWVKHGFRVPCELAVIHADGQQGTWTAAPYVRPGDDEMHPDHWNITGGVSAHEANLKILPDNQKYEKMSPKEAAAAFFKACAEENWGELLKFWPMPGETDRLERMKEYLGGLELVSLGEPFQTNNYPGWFVPYEIKFRAQELNVRVAKTNAAKRYVLVGLYNRNLRLQEEVKWSGEPTLLPNNDRYARMSPAEVVKAWADALARLDWDELAKFIPPGDVQDLKGQVEAAQRLGLDPRQIIPVVEVGEAFWSAEQSAYFVKCRFPGQVKKWNLALRNDNQTRRYLLDGGL